MSDKDPRIKHLENVRDEARAVYSQGTDTGPTRSVSKAQAQQKVEAAKVGLAAATEDGNKALAASYQKTIDEYGPIASYNARHTPPGSKAPDDAATKQLEADLEVAKAGFKEAADANDSAKVSFWNRQQTRIRQELAGAKAAVVSDEETDNPLEGVPNEKLWDAYLALNPTRRHQLRQHHPKTYRAVMEAKEDAGLRRLIGGHGSIG
jgi:hypothetical protein